MPKPWIHVQPLDLVRPEKTYRGSLCFCYMTETADYESILPVLHPEERVYYDALKFEKRIKSYLLGRWTAKQAVSALIDETNLADIRIRAGIFTQPVVVAKQSNIQVSVSHSDDFGAALAFPEVHPMGIDIEKIDQDRREALERYSTAAEMEKARSLPVPYDTGLMLLWTAKEALSKALRTGLMTPLEIYEISKIEVYDRYYISYYKNFAQYKAMTFAMGDFMCSITYPMKTKLVLDVKAVDVGFGLVG